MKKKLLLAIVIATMIGCSKDESTNSGGSQINKVEIYTSGYLKSTTHYQYDSNDNIKKIIFEEDQYTTTITEFFYNGNEITSYVKTRTSDFGGLNVTEDTFSFTLNANNNFDYLCIDRIESSTYDGQTDIDYYKDKVEVEYGSNNLPTTFTHYYPRNYYLDNPITCSDVTSVDFTEDLEYTNGNMTYYYGGGDFFFGDTHLVYEYDTKNHPLKNIKPDCVRNGLGFSTKNNIIKGYIYDHNTNELEQNINYTYEFNSDNYPTKVIKKTIDATNSPINFNSTVEYRYYYN